MPEWLASSLADGPDLALGSLVFRLVVATLLGGCVAGIYWGTHRRDDSLVPSFLSTLVLLAGLIAMVTQVIGDNVARAFSLVGALSIVRFRTVVEDTRDTAFVIFSVVVGMAVGAGHLEVALAGLVVMGCAAALMKPRTRMGSESGGQWTLSVRTGAGRTLQLENVMQRHVAESWLTSTATSRQGASLDLTYRIRLRDVNGATLLLNELNALEGVQSVEVRREG